MKKSVKILLVVLMAIIAVGLATVPCFATTGSGVWDQMNNVTPDGNVTAKFAEKAGKIIATLRNIAAVIAVIIVVILGIKYMLGSVEEKAEYKKSFVPLIVGVAVVVLALEIAKLIFGTFES